MADVVSVRIAVLDPLPIYRRGMLATLGNPVFEPETSEDLLAWVRQERHGIVLLTVQQPRDWSLLAELCSTSPDLIVVAVLEDASTEAYIRAILAGAAVAVSRAAPPESVRQAFKQAVMGVSALPIAVVRALAMSRESHTGVRPLPMHEVEWLRSLARGVTVAQLARRNGYSERAMFRLLRNLYDRLGVKGRTEALMLANRRGWL
jgi:DNA-binding NarL/FixJ family response regulator